MAAEYCFLPPKSRSEIFLSSLECMQQEREVWLFVGVGMCLCSVCTVAMCVSICMCVSGCMSWRIWIVMSEHVCLHVCECVCVSVGMCLGACICICM